MRRTQFRGKGRRAAAHAATRAFFIFAPTLVYADQAMPSQPAVVMLPIPPDSPPPSRAVVSVAGLAFDAPVETEMTLQVRR